ncbi:hypothetical protein BOO86_16090 [Mycobacterium sp. CBMA 234]|uniref:DUF5642 family protein n=1 Tax=Mycolicibacterium sp. CBMA 234 TaxID=1918495 RepID=UPI0012DEC98B|nr:DUF5642 family protein [Mycolicibacterium sp. CBMA 234]MUL65998.1 hypothetical protein [Mycolicibacterium sp. CBMA 234]
MLRTVLAVAAVGLVAACSSNTKPVAADPDITKILDLKTTFGPDFQVKTVAPTGIDPRAFAPQTLPAGLTFEPPDCAKFASGMAVPPGAKGNMTALTAEGQGNRYVILAVETSEPIAPADPGDNCKKVGFSGAGLRGMVEEVPTPAIDGVKTLGTHRVVEAVANGKPATGQLYNYVASFGRFMVIVTTNAVIEPNKPVPQVNTQKATELLTKSVTAVRGQ